METVTLNVKGMTCMGCVRSVKNVLEPIAGVSGVEVALEKGLVTIGYDSARTGIAAFKAAIEDAGYDVVA